MIRGIKYFPTKLLKFKHQQFSSIHQKHEKTLVKSVNREYCKFNTDFTNDMKMLKQPLIATSYYFWQFFR